MAVDRLHACKEAALEGASRAVHVRNSGQVGIAQTKEDSLVESFHAIVTNADKASQTAILKSLYRNDPGMHFVAEEDTVIPELREGSLKVLGLERIRERGAYIIDELDGSSSFKKGWPTWSVSVGFVDPNLRHTAGAVYAPEIRGGTLYYASIEGDTFVIAEGRQVRSHVSEERDLRKALVLHGPDLYLGRFRAHNRALTMIGDSTMTELSSGSCALALGQLAIGGLYPNIQPADVLVQTLQSPWDWAAGRVIVEQAGGRMIFYEMEQGKITNAYVEPQLRHYDPDIRGLGFVAGNPHLVEPVMDILIEANRGKTS